MPWVITKRGSMALPSTYASFASITYPPLEPTGRKTTTPHDWATWFPPQGARGTQYLMDLFNYKGPGFQHDDRHFAGVGRGLGANVRAYNDEHGALPGRLASLSDDFYCAVGFRHDAHRFRDIATPPFVPATLNDYEHLARSAYFDAFEYAVAKVLTAATAHHPLEREGAKWHEMLAEAVAEGQIKRDEAAAIVMLCKMMAVVDQAEIVCTARSFSSVTFVPRCFPPNMRSATGHRSQTSRPLDRPTWSRRISIYRSAMQTGMRHGSHKRSGCASKAR